MLTGGFNPDVVPEGFRKQPGPFVKIGTDEPTSADGLVSGLASSSSCASTVVCFQTFFYDEDLRGNRFLPEVGYEYSILHELAPTPLVGSGFADILGNFSVPCPALAADGGGTIQFDDARMKIEPNTWSSIPAFDRIAATGFRCMFRRTRGVCGRPRGAL